jgi:hypothetical protein
MVLRIVIPIGEIQKVDSAMAYTPRPVDDTEMDATYSVPTLIVNRFVVATTNQNTRIAFGEARLEAPTTYRVALSMTTFEAFELLKVMETLLEPYREQFESLVSEAPKGDGPIS